MPGHSKDFVSQQEPPLVAIGGSAGSVEALIHFFELIPEDCGLAFIVAVHLAPNQESQLPELLQRRCALTVVHARDEQKIEANHVYVIPPGRTLAKSKNRLKIDALTHVPRRIAVIDMLFESVAAQAHGHVAGILLSGGDSDGAAGMQCIKKAGGLTLAQDPAEAQQVTMPRAAIDSGCVEAVMRVVDMPAQLLSSFGIDLPLRQPPQRHLAKSQPPLALSDKESAQVQAIVEAVQQRTGRDFSCYREEMILRHIQRRIDRTDTENPDGYLELLEADAAEPDALIRELLVSVTEFFRDPDAFSALAGFAQELFEGKSESDFVRVWVPACATGEEAYSIAMLLLERASTLAHPPGIQVFGCDLDRNAIEKARAGMYRASAVLPIGPERLTRFFQKEAIGYRVRRELRQVVLFAEHDVIWDPNFTQMDLISCRNLLIYLNPEGQRRMVGVFEDSLKTNGLLFLGPVEGPKDLTPSFQLVDRKNRIYRRIVEPAPAGQGLDNIQRSLTMEQLAYSKAMRQKGGKVGTSLNQLQDQLDYLQQRLLGSGLQDTSYADEKKQLQLITHELHATLEELDVNRQELRSMNAELTAVNLVLSEKLGELEHTNSDLNNLMNAAAIPMVFLNSELKIMRYTPRALDLFRLIPSDIGRPLSDLQAGVEYPDLMADAERVLLGSEPIEHEVRGRFGKWFFARVLPYFVQQNRVAGVVLTFFDITERKQSEAALKASEEKLRTFISATSEIVYEMSADWLEMRSLEGKNFITTTEIPRVDWSEEYIPEIEKPRVWEAIQHAIATRSPFELEHRVVRIDGSTGWVFSRAIPLFNDRNEIVKWFGTASDITARKQTEEALHESEATYRSLFNSIDEGFCIIEVLFDDEAKPVDYRFLETNEAVERQTGIQNATGRLMREIAPRHETFWFEVYGRIALTGEPMRFEKEAKALGHYYDVYAFRVGEPELRRVGILFNDISVRKRSEARLKLALGATQMGYYEWYPDEDRTVADANLLALFGLPADAKLTHAGVMASMVHPDDRARHESVLRQALDPSGDGNFRDEVRIIGQDGVERWLAFSGHAEFQGEPARPWRLTGVACDVSSRKSI